MVGINTVIARLIRISGCVGVELIEALANCARSPALRIPADCQ